MTEYLPEGHRCPLQRNKEHIASVAGLLRAIEKNITLEAPATLCDRDFNLHIALGERIVGIIERSEVEFSPSGEDIKDIAVLTRVGRPVCFKVLDVTRTADGAVARLSRRSAQKECHDRYISALSGGDIIPARVTHIEPFGAFLDIGCGITSLLSIDAISVSRISHPKDRVSVGEDIFVIVKEFDELSRVSVSQKELFGTWEENAAKFSEGQTVRGIVRSVESYGIFVELSPNLAGLAELKAGVEVGQSCAVYIKSIIPEKMKVKLIIIDTASEEFTREREYFIDPLCARHIDRWVYSPPSAKRVIESVFN